MFEIELVNNQKLKIFSGEIGILFSGGADSMLLAYLLAYYKPNDIIHFFTCSASFKHHKPFKKSHEALVALMAKIPGLNSRIFHHIHYVELMTDDSLFPPINQQRGDPSKFVIYTGVTADPPWGIEFTIARSEAHKRDPSIIRPDYRSDKNICTPFTNLNKKHIAQLYQRYDIMDLFDHSYSCARKEPDLTQCGKCWWCQERLWGFDRL